MPSTRPSCPLRGGHAPRHQRRRAEVPSPGGLRAKAERIGWLGIPGDPIGVVIGGVLGWPPTRATFETRGLLAPWVVHFLQDVVSYSTIALLGGY